MQHLDEGTIHAWLDGALDAEESARIEAHVAQCEVCSAAVAEARGFIAGTSRILGALDHVPVNVIPREPARDGAAATITPPRARRFRVTPAWMAAAAAVLVIAVSVWSRDGSMASREQYSPSSAPRVAASAQDTSVPANDALGTSAGGAAPVASQKVTRQEKAVQGPAPRPMVAEAPRAVPPPAPRPQVRAMIAASTNDTTLAKKAEQRVAEMRTADSVSVANADSVRTDRDVRLRRAFTAQSQLQQVATAAPAEAKDAAITTGQALQGCYEVASTELNAAPSPAPSAAVPMRGQRSGAVAGVSGRANVAASAFVLDSTRYTRSGASAASQNVFAVGTRSVIGNWVMLSPSSARVVFDENSRSALHVTLAPNGAVLARPANDTTLPATVLRRCP